MGGGACDGAAKSGAIAADKLLGAVDNHLRGINLVEREVNRVVALPFGHCVEGKWIAPAEVIPVGDVLAEDDGLRSGNELGRVEASEERVGRRAVGTAFGGEELDQNWLAGERMLELKLAARLPRATRLRTAHRSGGKRNIGLRAREAIGLFDGESGSEVTRCEMKSDAGLTAPLF